MNSKERVIAAMAHKPVDRIPLGFYAVDHDTISRVIGRKTMIRDKVETQIAIWEGRRDDMLQSYKNDSVEFYRKIDCADLILFKDAPLLPPKGYTPDPPKKIGEDTWEDRDGRIWKANRKANDILVVKEADKKKEYTMDEFKIPEKFTPPDESIFEAVDHLIKEMGKDRYIASLTQIEPIPFFGNFEDTMMNFGLQPELVKAALDYNAAYWNFMDKFYVRPGMDGAHGEQDMAGTNCPFISPDMFREFCMPYLTSRVKSIKKHVPRLSFHCCGNTIPIMDMFIEAGIDCYQSMQTTAGMEIGKLKGLFGDKIAFWGGIPLETLIDGSPDDTRKAVRTALERGSKGSGFILGISHSVAYGTKYDNFMAMLDEFVKLRDKYI